MHSLITFFYFFTSFFGFIIFFIIIFQFKENRNTNGFLAYFIFLSSLRFLTFCSPNIPINGFYIYTENFMILNAWPTLYLYFYKLVINTNKLKLKDLLHYIIPLMIFIIFCNKSILEELHYSILISKVFFVVVFIGNLIYMGISFKLLYKNVWNRNSKILLITQQNKVISKWTKFLFFIFIIMFIRVLINLFGHNDHVWYINTNNYLWIAAIIWVIMYVKMISSPEFLFGYEVFQNKIKEYKKHNIIFDNIWKKKSNIEIVNVQDSILQDKIESSVVSYIIEIEHLALNSDIFFDNGFSMDDLARKLNLPKSHISFVFKYHSSISFTEFKKIIRVQKSIELLENGFLKSNTMEYLASSIGFSSYSSFFKSFKNITGYSPQEYCKKVQ
jgi:AraC-like DNA-binding protein